MSRVIPLVVTAALALGALVASGVAESRPVIVVGVAPWAAYPAPVVIAPYGYWRAWPHGYWRRARYWH